MVILFLLALFVVVVIAANAGRKHGFSFGTPTLAERGEAVGRDADDRGFLGPKIADNVGLAIAFDYRNAMGQDSRRAVMIDGVFGPSLSDPEYIHGSDSQSRERRTFKVSRIARLIKGDGATATESNIGWWIGAMIRSQLKQPVMLPPCELAAETPAKVILVFAKERIEGDLRGVAYGYWNGQPWCKARILGSRGKTGALRERTFSILGATPPAVFCGETGEEIAAPARWLVDKCGGEIAALKAVGFAVG